MIYDDVGKEQTMEYDGGEEAHLLRDVAHYVEETLGEEGYRYTSVTVANCRMLAIQQEERSEASETDDAIDMDALIIAGYLHDISTVSQGYNDHQQASARMAMDFLRERNCPESRMYRVEQAILHHATRTSPEQRVTTPIEARILYDADRLGRLSGLSVVTSLIEFGARYPDRPMTSEMLSAILRHIEERFIDLYQSLYTEAAREMAREKFGKTIDFLDGVIEHLSDATPV